MNCAMIIKILSTPDKLVFVETQVRYMRFNVFDEAQAVLPVAGGRLYRGIKAEEVIVDVLDEDLAQVFARH